MLKPVPPWTWDVPLSDGPPPAIFGGGSFWAKMVSWVPEVGSASISDVAGDGTEGKSEDMIRRWKLRKTLVLTGSIMVGGKHSSNRTE